MYLINIQDLAYKISLILLCFVKAILMPILQLKYLVTNYADHQSVIIPTFLFVLNITFSFLYFALNLRYSTGCKL